ncbi:glycosyltransferase family 43, putative [Bodo saltans]|uniref:Glycosyltransferase family 43, putative n=1 Tax=Bodo saltans TaxID=75058 RepID=A0A0S4KJP6_BODSA|nr:glycosyltransferase family 43, putative [Bodo saltans]|eukprot:CUI14504.1 glycosyltransferase family 43, putative [Bodo saltans]
MNAFIVVCVLGLLLSSLAAAADPFIPTSGWTIYLEGVRAAPWPSCPYRFLSYPAPACNEANLWDGAGIDQDFTLESVPGATALTFYLKASCGQYLSYPGPCDQHEVNMWPYAGINQEFTFVPTGSGNPGEYFIVAQGRASCPYHYMSFPVPCSTDAPDLVNLWYAAGPEQTWRVYPASYPAPAARSPVAGSCADVFTWPSPNQDKYYLSCTGGDIAFQTADDISESTVFANKGSQLGGSPPAWCSNGNRWAPETYQLPNAPNISVMVVADLQSDGSHRIGYVYSHKGAGPQHWTEYSPNYLTLSPGTQGDIDPHIFLDPTTNKTYLIWKSDDNRIGIQTTRIWAQELIIHNDHIDQVGTPQVIMDSTGLWWATGFNGEWSTLVEGPEMIYRDGYYFLLFAGGQYCGWNYGEGAARATSIFGPYEKMGTPLLWAPIAGTYQGTQLRGPGHATFVNDRAGQLFIIFPAHTDDDQCNRLPFIGKIHFVNNWPRFDVPFG